MSTPRPTEPTDWRTLREAYDRRAEEQYQPDPSREPRPLSRKHRGVIAHLDFAPDSCVLDAGCGDGVYGEWLSRRDHTLIVCADLSPTIVAAARQNIAARGEPSITRFVAGNLEALPFANGRFDAIVCSQVIEHLLDDRAGFAALSRMLKPSGVLVITTDNRDNRVTRWLALPVRLARAVLRRRTYHPPFPHADYRMAEFRSRVEQAGLTVVQAESFRFSWPVALQRARALVHALDWIEARTIRLPRLRNWGDILLIKAVKR